MDNMHIKWKLKSFWTHICCLKVLLCIIFFEKIWFLNLLLQFLKEKKIDQKFFKNFFLQPPIFLEWFQTLKMEITWRFDSVDAIQDIGANSQSCCGHIPTPHHHHHLIRIKHILVLHWRASKNFINHFLSILTTWLPPVESFTS